MKINKKKCIDCNQCIPYCPVGAIRQVDYKCIIDQDTCVECYVCFRSNICKKEAFEKVSLGWPRIIRHIFSDPKKIHKTTGIYGRGTEEMKTNDITNRFKIGEVGFTIDVGRPGIGTSFKDVEKITMAVAKLNVEFENKNPITNKMSDKKIGKISNDIINERVLSAVIEFKTKEDKLVQVLNTLKDVAKEINTVFSVGCIGKVKLNGEIPVKSILDKAGIYYRPNGKINIGLAKNK